MAQPQTPPAAAPEAGPAVWTQWRGPGRTATVAGEWPAKLDDKTLTKRWHAELAEGYSTPIVIADRVFTFETKDKKDEVVRAFDRTTGTQVWSLSWPGTFSVPFFAKKNGSWVRATPIYDPSTDRLYVGGIREQLVCIDATKGTELWRIDFPKQYERDLPGFGFVCSPLIEGDFLFVQAGAGVCKVNKHTGEIVWRKLQDMGGMWGGAFSSPVVATIAGVKQIVVQTRSTLVGMAIDTGQPLWSTPVKAFRGMNILTPLVVDSRVFTAAYGGSSHAFDVTRDADGNWAVTEAWKIKLQGYMSSPVAVDGHVYLHTRDRRVVCLRLSDGEKRWSSDKKFGEYASLVTNGKSILALDENGELTLFKADPAGYTELDERRVIDNTWAHVVVVGEEVYVRDLKGLTAYRWAD